MLGRQRRMAAESLSCSRTSIVAALGHGADISPVFQPNIRVDFNASALTIEAICAVLARAGNPIVFAGRNVIKVRLEPSALQALKRPALVVDRLPGFREGDASNTRGAGEPSGLALDIHDARLHKRIVED